MLKVILLLLMVFPYPCYAADFKLNELDPSYDHDKWGTSADCIIKDFTAYKSCFDNEDDNNGDGSSDVWGIPKWVAYEMKRTEKPCIKTYDRPSAWITEPELFAKGLMPNDKSYAYPKSFTSKHKDWFSRGHLAMKMHTERLGANAGWNSHSFYNAVPQRQLFNGGIWLDLEDLTAAWAQEYGAVWIIDGPIFADKSPHAYLGQEGESPVAIPDALFKIVIKEGASSNTPDVLAFIYPQVGAGYYRGKPYDHTRYMTNVEEIQKITGLRFLEKIPAQSRKRILGEDHRELWAVKPQDFIKSCGGQYNE